MTVITFKLVYKHIYIYVYIMERPIKIIEKKLQLSRLKIDFFLFIYNNTFRSRILLMECSSSCSS